MPVQTGGYADDVAAIIAQRNLEEAQLRLGTVIGRVNGCVIDHGLSLAVSKT